MHHSLRIIMDYHALGKYLSDDLLYYRLPLDDASAR